MPRLFLALPTVATAARLLAREASEQHTGTRIVPFQIPLMLPLETPLDGPFAMPGSIAAAFNEPELTGGFMNELTPEQVPLADSDAMEKMMREAHSQTMSRSIATEKAKDGKE